MKAIVTKLSDN